ncbi:hypothetical protein BO226_17485 [Rhodococcus sp. 2G]|uniref:hypothetical protein n=1 Tax=Rhodococcus sp. 2G TaxID=1570939 RepID=UPI000904115A|nr:hypothetical protein [Rhodococcus sp. 2G]APE10767.1 hypothetical protein BO226_17485 [Rhodococcus sp. 2G]
MTGPVQTLISRTDVANLLGETLTDVEVGQVDALIDFASEKLRAPEQRAVVGDIDDRLADGSLRPGLLRGVLVTVVCRAFDALRVGLRVRSEQYPELQTTYADSLPELVYFTESELADLAPEPETGATGSGAFTIRIG